MFICASLTCTLVGDFGLATESMDAVDPADKTVSGPLDHEITLGTPSLMVIEHLLTESEF